MSLDKRKLNVHCGYRVELKKYGYIPRGPRNQPEQDGRGALRLLSRDPQSCVRDSVSGASGSIVGGQTEPKVHLPSTRRQDTVPSQLAAEEGRANGAVEGQNTALAGSKSSADGASAVGSQ